MMMSRVLKGIVFLLIGIFLLILPLRIGGWALIFWIFPTFFFVAAHGYLSNEFFEK